MKVHYAIKNCHGLYSDLPFSTLDKTLSIPLKSYPHEQGLEWFAWVKLAALITIHYTGKYLYPIL